MPNPFIFLLSYLGPIFFMLFMGAALLLLGFKVTRLPGLSYQQHWIAFFIGLSCGFVVMQVVQRSWPVSDLSPLERLASQLGIWSAAEVVVIPLVLRQFRPLALAIQVGAVLLTNLITFALFLGLHLVMRK